MSRGAVIEGIAREKIVVILRGYTEEELLSIAAAVEAGGVHYLEITFDATGRVPAWETARQIGAVKEKFPHLHVGAGTVLTVEQVEAAAGAGAEFLISPDVNGEVIRKTRELGLVSIPGAFTATEAQAAHRAGADFVKLFPAGNMPSAYLASLAAPLSHIRFLAVGAIHEKNAPEYLRAGAVGVGVGSIVEKAAVKAGDFARVTNRVRALADAIGAGE